MGATIWFVASFIAAYSGVIFFPKVNRRINAVKNSILLFMLLWCTISMCGGIFTLIHIPVNIKSVSCFLSCLAVILWGYIIIQRKIQRLSVTIYDIVAVIVLAILFLSVYWKIFGAEQRLAYTNSDPARHYAMALTVLKEEKATGMFFSPLFNALCMETLSPFISSGVRLYRAFILADSLMNLMELLFFYALVRDCARTWRDKFIVLAGCVLYFGGYPFISYAVGGFVYWGVGVTMMLLIMQLLRYYQKWPEYRKLLLGCMFFALYGVMTSYVLFLPASLLGILLSLLYIHRENVNPAAVFRDKRILIGGIIGGGFIVLGAVHLFNYYFGGSLKNVFSGLSNVGWIYNELYMQFLFFVPIIVYSIHKSLKNRRVDVEQIWLGCVLFHTLVSFGIMIAGMMSAYYYYKIYWPLWGILWIITIRELRNWLADEKMMAWTMVGMMSFAGVMRLGGIEEKLGERVYLLNDKVGYETYIYGQTSPINLTRTLRVNDSLFSIYAFPLYRLSDEVDYSQLAMPDDLLDCFEYIVSELPEERVAYIKASESLGTAQDWFLAITGKEIVVCDIHEDSFEKIISDLKENGITHIMVAKQQELYVEFRKEIDALSSCHDTSRAGVYLLE